jgi:hypothetical protein
MYVKIKAKVKGKKEKEIEMYVNSYSDYSILTPEIIREIEAKLVKAREEIRVGGGGKIEAPVFEISIEVEDPVTKKVKEVKTRAIALEEEEPVIGNYFLYRNLFKRIF